MKQILHGVMLGALLWASSGCSEEKTPSPPKAGEPVLHFGCCDASAGVALSSNLFVVGNDEDSLLRIYRRDRSGPPVQAFALESFLGVDFRKPESDLEAAARLGDRIYWITSHGRNKTGQARESRHRFFATTIELRGGAVELKTVDRPYERLLDDLLREPRLAKFRLAAAAQLPPKEPNALNIEGLCATPDNHLLIGFRNPIPGGRALIVPLLNPSELLEGKAARFGDPLLLDLGGLGVRDMTYANERYLIAAGPFDGGGKSHLYQWQGGTNRPVEFKHTHLKGINVEAVLSYPGSATNEVQVLSDDGTLKIGGQDCKTLMDPKQKRFRSYWIKLDEPAMEARAQ